MFDTDLILRFVIGNHRQRFALARYVEGIAKALTRRLLKDEPGIGARESLGARHNVFREEGAGLPMTPATCWSIPVYGIFGNCGRGAEAVEADLMNRRDYRSSTAPGSVIGTLNRTRETFSLARDRSAPPDPIPRTLIAPLAAPLVCVVTATSNCTTV